MDVEDCVLRERLRVKRKKSPLATEPSWSLCIPPSVLFTRCEISINMLKRNDEKDTTAEYVRQKMLWGQINSPEFKFSSASYKPVSCCFVH